MDIWFNIVLNCEDGMGWFLYVKFHALLGWFKSTGEFIDETECRLGKSGRLFNI